MRQYLCHPLTSLPCMAEESDHHCSGSLYCTVRLRCSGSLRCTVRLRCSGSLRYTVRLRCSGSLHCTVHLHSAGLHCFPVKDCFTSSNALPSSCSAALKASPALLTKSCALETGAPQYGQNFVESGISFPHFSQNIFFLLFLFAFYYTNDTKQDIVFRLKDHDIIS